jgi:hypothetical protein
MASPQRVELVVLQLIAGIHAVLSRDAIAAALMLTFSGAWLGTGFIS